MLKNRIYKIANNPSFDFFWHNNEKIVQDALPHRRSQDFSKGGSHCVKVRVLVCLDIFQAETSRHFGHLF